LATKFIERFPKIAKAGLGEDWEYAGWYVQMLGFAERGEFPLAYSDCYEDLIPDGCNNQKDQEQFANATAPLRPVTIFTIPIVSSPQ